MINEQVYGAKSTWLDTQYQYTTITPKAKKANFGGEGALLMTGVATGKLSYTDPIDKSIGYCGLGTESALSHLTYIGIKNGEPSIISTQDRFVTNFCWCEKTLNNPPTLFGSYFQYNSIDRHAWGDYATTFNYNKIVEPLTLVCPQNQILLIWVNALNSDFSQGWNGSLKEYESTYHTTYPNITCVYLRTFFGNKAQNITMYEYTAQGLKIPWQLSILDNYVCDDFNLDFYDYAEPQNVVFGVFNNTYYMYKSDYFAIVSTTENAVEHIKIVDLNTINYNIYIEYYSDFAEDVRKTVACFGLYFTDDLATAQNGTLTLSDMYIGLLDDDGIGHGNYLKGTDTANAPQNNWDDMTDSGYDYTKDVDKTKYKNDTEFNLLYNASSVTTFYVLNDLQVNQLAQELYTILSNVPVDAAIEKYNQQVFLTNNAIDCIVSLKRFPLASLPVVGQDEYVKLGTQTTSIRAYRLQAPAKVYYFNFSSASNTSLYPHFDKSFLDYEPYTKVKINIPFCGSIEVPCTYLYDYGSVTVALAIDFITGGCTGYVICHGIVIDSVNGQCSVELPLSGIQSSTVDSQIFSASQQKIKQETSLGLGILAGAVAIGAGIATGGMAAVAGGALAIGTSAANYVQSERELDYELTHMQAPLKQVGAASGQISELYDTRCKMVITRPKIDPAFENSPEAQEAYARTIGYACLISGEVSEFTGFTVGSIDLDGVAAPATIKEMIKNMFTQGVYL